MQICRVIAEPDGTTTSDQIEVPPGDASDLRKVTISTDRQTADQLASGQLQLAEAMRLGKVRFSGELSTIAQIGAALA